MSSSALQVDGKDCPSVLNQDVIIYKSLKMYVGRKEKK